MPDLPGMQSSTVSIGKEGSMSKLTNFQIRAQIASLEAALRVDGLDCMASTPASRKRRQKLADYRLELAEREAAGLNPGTEIQGSLHGEPRRKP